MQLYKEVCVRGNQILSIDLLGVHQMILLCLQLHSIFQVLQEDSVV